MQTDNAVDVLLDKLYYAIYNEENRMDDDIWFRETIQIGSFGEFV